MYIVRLKIKTESQYLIDQGCPEWVEINCKKFSILEAAAQYCRERNEYTEKFHPERIGKIIHYIVEDENGEVVK